VRWQRNIVEQHLPPHHYLFNTDIVAPDVSIFDISAGNSSATKRNGKQADIQPSDAPLRNTNGRGSVYFKTIRTTSDDIRVVVKDYQRGGMVRHVNKSLYWHRRYSESRVWREFHLLTEMIALGLPVPTPVAGRVTRKLPQWYTSTIVTREIEQTVTLAERLHQLIPEHGDEDLWVATGRTIKRFHEANVYHADLNASNILIADSGDIFLIDFDKGQFKTDNRTDWKQSNLQRLKRSLLKFKRGSLNGESNHGLNQQSTFRFSDDSWQLLLSGYSR
jgi:3-deoxy-D-manno-octulosonic acid kinase